jgi:hypothetical protein
MARNKAKRTILLAQPTRRSANSQTKPDASMPEPVKAHVYRSIAELNDGFEKVVQELLRLGAMNLFRSNGLTGMRQAICRMRADVNRDFSMVIHEREKVNATYLGRGSA